MTKSSLPQSVMPSVRLKFFFLDNISLLHLNRLRIMKTQQSVLNVVVILAAAVSTLFVTGCAEVGSGNTTSLLTAAGFRARTPQTPRQQQIYAALPPYQVERATVKGHVFYVYKDEKAGVAYIGREPEYQRAHQLAVSAADCSKLLHGSGDGPCSRIWLVRRMGPARVM